MRFKTLIGSERTVSKSKKYLVDWDGSSRSKLQKATKTFLKKYWHKHIVFEEFPVVGTRLSLDFYNANKKIAVEVQGDQHTKFVKHFHKTRLKYLDQLNRDQKKLDFCNLNDILLIEIYSSDVVDTDFFESLGVYL